VKIVSVFFLLLFAVAANAQTLAQRIDSLIAAPPFDHAIWGIDIEDDAGNVLYAHNGHTLLMPASNRKLFSAATVANCFGFDHQFTTELWLADRLSVVIRGGGDPSLGGRWAFNRDDVFAPFVAALRARHITRIGDVYADPSAFDRTTIPGSWKFGNLGADYAAPVDALGYNENVFGLWVDDCAHPLVTTDPLFLRTTANTVCGAGEPIVRVDPTNTVAVYGAIPQHASALPAIDNPALYAAQALYQALRHAGFEVIGSFGVTAPQPWRERIATIESPPLWQLLSVELKPSQNLYAETLYKDLSLDQPASYAASSDVERHFLVDVVGLDPNEFRFVDGSGLAPDDLVTPSSIVKVLRYMNAPQRRGAWWMLLATPGEEGGTLRRRLVELAPRLRGKTGTIAGVNALSAIIAGAGGQFRYLSIVINHHIADSGDASKIIDAIAREAAGF